MPADADLLTVTAVSKLTGIDRRTLDRILASVSPASRARAGARESRRYRRADVLRAFEVHNIDPSRAAGLMPLGGSLVRHVAWEVLEVHAAMFAGAAARGYRELAVKHGLAPEAAAAFAAELVVTAVYCADEMLSAFATWVPEAAEVDASVSRGSVVGRDAAPGEFCAAVSFDDSEVRAMIAAGLANRAARTG